ncbi:uncharacterized protein G2W53_043389 [Senna tora]|uniref:Uncharacterized protein n=1 Tax=Senna tora TaxID=362788 RepID=A0A834SHP3_9FABA|nr:uncharacterized protein G2W53_043389 [Senna tora]
MPDYCWGLVKIVRSAFVSLPLFAKASAHLLPSRYECWILQLLKDFDSDLKGPKFCKKCVSFASEFVEARDMSSMIISDDSS